MNLRKKIVYSIFVVVSIYGFYFHFLSGEPQKGRTTVKPENNVFQTANTNIHKPVSSPKIVADTTKNMPKLVYYHRGNPFKTKISGYSGVPTAVSTTQSFRPNITAISNDGPESLVIANNKVIRIGEFVGKWRLSRVESEKALFEGPDGAIWIYLGGER